MCRNNFVENLLKMSGNSLQVFRDKLTLVYLNDLVDIGDFVFLYDASQSKLSFPY